MLPKRTIILIVSTVAVFCIWILSHSSIMRVIGLVGGYEIIWRIHSGCGHFSADFSDTPGFGFEFKTQRFDEPSPFDCFAVPTMRSTVLGEIPEFSFYFIENRLAGLYVTIPIWIPTLILALGATLTFVCWRDKTRNEQDEDAKPDRATS